MTIDFNDKELDLILVALQDYMFVAYSDNSKYDFVTSNKLYTLMLGFKRRGLRNNNPFNIKKSHFKWVGKKSISSDPVFEQFENMYFGLRAGMKLLVNYVNKGFNTPRKIIYRFAPNSENNSQLYLNYVCTSGHFPLCPDVPITSLFVLCNLASSMVRYENGISETLVCNIKADPSALLDLCKFYKLNLK